MSEESPSTVLDMAARAIERRLAAFTRLHGLTPGMLRVLQALVTEPGMTAADLRRQLRLEKNSALHIVRALERRKLIVRRRDQSLPNATSNIPTAKGQHAATSATAEIAMIDHELARIMDQPGQSFRVKLKRIAEFD